MIYIPCREKRKEYKMRGKYIEIDKNLLLETYENCGRSLNQTGKILGISAKTIKRKFVEYGLEYDKKIEYSCNEDFFNELNEQSLYWLGFLATDGNLYKNKYSYEITLSLATKDIDILKKFKTHINFTGPIHSYIVKNNKKDVNFKQDEYYRSSIRFTSEKIFNHLSNFNIVPAKTHILEFPKQLKNNPLLHHFIRGCIDGDGWDREHKNNGSEITTEVRIGMCGTEKFVSEIYKIIKEKLNIEGGHLAHKKDTNSWFFEFSGLHDVDKIVDWIYQDATIYLERKYEIAKQSKEFAARYIPITISKDELTQIYNDCGSIRQTAISLDIDPLTVKNRLIKFDIEHKIKKEAEYNHQFFENETEGKYYWAGFLAGKSTYINDKKYLAFNCSEKEVIDSFMKQSEMDIHITQLKKNDQSITYQINIFDEIILSQLEKFNINKDKQNNYFIPDWLLKSDYLRHFLRGYLDARSGLMLYKNKLSLNIKNSQQFLQQINEIFNKNCSMPLTAKIKDTGKGSWQIIYLTNQAKSILDYLYQDATIYLPRKREIAMMAKQFQESLK